jgi:hypothetical protein
MLNNQPGLKRFREGLVDAQISASQLSGKFTEEHPLVIASTSAQNTIIQRFSRELRASTESIEADISVIEKKRERLESQKSMLEGRLSRLADSRAIYANLASDVKSRNTILENAEKELAEATAARDSSKSTSLLTRLDAPIVSDKPIGPGKTTLAVVCTAAGLAFGLGIVFLITPIDAGPTFGRRISDRFYGRRYTDTVSNESSTSSSASTSDARSPDPSPAAVERAFRDVSLRSSAENTTGSRYFETDEEEPRAKPRASSRKTDSREG